MVPFFSEMEEKKSAASLYTIDYILTIQFSNNHYLSKYFKKVNRSHIAALSSFSKQPKIADSFSNEPKLTYKRK